MYHLLKSNGWGSPTVISTHDTFDEALLAAERLPILHVQVDEDHEGCADLITTDGDLYLIEPASWQLPIVEA
jgi:hypothetical protein